ncbi:MAG: ParB/RepB/Spo0J family partition protein [Clostridia bacterium]|nr:ParB/RepB/Spo0J family partition protein [Clostridia bacterium]
MAKHGLGRGLDALLADNSIDELENRSGIALLKISDIEPNRSQARKSFDREALDELAESIKLHGILQPITVRQKENGYYEIIAGERRWRASKIAGLTEIPAIVKEADDLLAGELSLIENLQRENLNAVEEACGYRDLIQNYGLTQEEAADKVGKSRVAVTNLIRILKLPKPVLDMIEKGSISYGHARAMIPLTQVFGDKETVKFAEKVVEEGLSVRQTERAVKIIQSGKPVSGNRENVVGKSYYSKLENEISSAIGRKTTISRRTDGKGRISIAFSGTDDLEALIRTLCGKDFFTE